MKRNKEEKKTGQAEVEDEIEKLIKQVKRKKSALKKFLKLIPDKNEKENSF